MVSSSSITGILQLLRIHFSPASFIAHVQMLTVLKGSFNPLINWYWVLQLFLSETRETAHFPEKDGNSWGTSNCKYLRKERNNVWEAFKYIPYILLNVFTYNNCPNLPQTLWAQPLAHACMSSHLFSLFLSNYFIEK